jgi:hypothetical protein
MILPGISVQKIRQREVQAKQNLYNGGYPAHFKLYKNFLEMAKDYTKLVPVGTKFVKIKVIKMYISITLQVIFKPLLCVFHSFNLYNSKFTVTESNEIEKIQSYSKESTLYLFKVIPIWYSTSDKPKTKNDFEIFK